MLRLMEEQSLFQLSQVGLKVGAATLSLRNRHHVFYVRERISPSSRIVLQTNALLKEHNQVLASLMLAQNPNSGLDAPNMLQKPSMQSQGALGR
jgi:hypothetical protein